MSRTQYCRGISWLLLAFLLGVGCDDPGVPIVPKLDVAPAGTRLTALHDSVRLFVTAHDGTNPVQIETAEWESKNAAIFSVNDDGWVTALANGVANGAVNALGQSKLFSVEVSQTPCPGTGMSHELKVRDLGAVWSIDVRDCNAYRIAPEDAEFHSSGPNVISIGSDGVATAVGTGTAIITVTAGGTSANLAVTIEGDPIGLRVTPAGPIVMMALGDTVPLSATLNDATLNVGFESSNPLSVFVDEEGRLVSIDGGHAFVTAWVHEHPDVRQVIDVTVQQAVCSVNDVPALPPVLTIGYSWAIVAFDCNGHHIDPINVAFTTSNPSVVGVDPNGVATIVGSGTATVAVAAGGRSIERTFSIGPAPPVVLDIAPAGPG